MNNDVAVNSTRNKMSAVWTPTDRVYSGSMMSRVMDTLLSETKEIQIHRQSTDAMEDNIKGYTVKNNSEKK